MVSRQGLFFSGLVIVLNEVCHGIGGRLCCALFQAIVSFVRFASVGDNLSKW